MGFSSAILVVGIVVVMLINSVLLLSWRCRWYELSLLGCNDSGELLVFTSYSDAGFK